MMYRHDVYEMDGDKLYRKVHLEMLMGREASKEIKDPETGKTLVREGRKMTQPGGQAPETSARWAASRCPRAEAHRPLRRLRPGRPGHRRADRGPQPAHHRGHHQQDARRGRGPRAGAVHRRGQPYPAASATPWSWTRLKRPTKPSWTSTASFAPPTRPTLEVARTFFHNLFFSSEHYDLSAVGRLKMNLRLGLDVPEDERTLRREDIMTAVKELIHLKDTEGPVDDIDHLGNRRVRAVGELLGEPVSHRPGAHGAGHQGAHEPAGDRGA